ncbi:MFS transporter [Spongisporangium articulatum]|uniref:MFS transporter n=1 Tax=Spongisporangium articulatum TaxID=3362603 RepID=A0ABW8ARU4_9ACTN
MSTAETRADVRERRAWYVYDWANSAYVTTVATVLFLPYLTVVAKRAACPGRDTDLACPVDLHVLGIPVSPGSVALYAITAATLISAVFLPVVGAFADRSDRKRVILARLAWTGAASASAMVLVSGTNWQLGVVLLILSQFSLASSLVVYDAILCDIAPLEQRDAVSSRGWAAGYLGGGLLLAINLGVVTAHDSLGLSTEAAVRISLLSAGLWWGLFTLVPYFGLRDRPAVHRVSDDPADRSPATLTQLLHTLRELRRYPQAWLFLLAYLFFNDGIQTVIYASSIFGQEQLGFESNQLIVAILLVQFVAFFGALIFGWVARGAGPKNTILGGLVLWCVVVGIGYFLPEHRFGLFLLLAVLIGIVLGGTQALARSLFSRLLPHGREAEYFSLYQCCERGTSWLGTLIFGLVYQLTGSYRDAIIALVAFFLVGGALLTRVDVEQGIADAAQEEPLAA